MLLRLVRNAFARHGRPGRGPAQVSVSRDGLPAVLNVGGGGKEIAIPQHYNGWHHLLLDIDSRGGADIVCDARELIDQVPAQFDAVYCSHNLEHYYPHDSERVLRGFAHVLKADGFAEIRVPDIAAVMRSMMERGLDIDDVLYQSAVGPILVRDVIYGWHVEIKKTGRDFYAHKTGYTARSLSASLLRNGFMHVALVPPLGTHEIRAFTFKQAPSEARCAALGIPAQREKDVANNDNKTFHLPRLGELRLDRTLLFATQTNWGVRDPERFHALMEEAKTLVEPGYYLGDNLFTWLRNNSVFEDAPFQAAWKSNITNASDQAIAWRRYILACAACHCVQLEGDFVECGVYQGTGLKTVVDYLGGTAFPKTFWGYDTFDYHPVPGHALDSQYARLHEQVLQRFNDYPQVKFIKGLLPDSFADGLPERVAYLHIDLNNADSEIAVLERLFDRVVSGGIIILDDYEWAGIYRAQKKAEDSWFAARSYRVFPLPTGQGFVLKR